MALQDILNLRTYIAENDPEAANKVGLRIDKSVGNLAQMPNLGKPGRVRGTRELVIAGTLYLVVYRLQEERIEVLRVLHGRQSFPEKL